ncbi:hypothetical protein H5410_036444 [Solanum commersonii]|uniref:Uncharacterized protein n=1 Tax=Solanum commersonii TaxID=4109 RepID=A0A9J5Y7H5_SOLCO|nr:hypothetical protein H5410_036444 [Solanum commersonii]
MRSFCEGPSVAYRDFNTTRFPPEKTNCTRLSRAISISYEFLTQIRQSTLQSLSLDHNPIVLTFGDETFRNSSGGRIKKGNLRVRKDQFIEQLRSLEAIQELKTLTDDDEHLIRDNLKMKYEEAEKNEEFHWRQRFRNQWINSGNKNTKFFQRMASSHKRIYNIDIMKINEVMKIEHLETKNSLVGVKLCAIEKALDRHGYTMAYFQVFFNSKEGFGNELRDFIPISLITRVYKIIPKVLAKRLKT